MANERSRGALVVSCCLVFFSPESVASVRGSPDTLFFSEYVEGFLNDKAVEIYNGLDAPVELAGCSVRIYFNGSPTPQAPIALTGTLVVNEAFVLANNMATFAATADQTSASLTFNGDDAVELTCAGMVVDAIGQIGFDPGSQWGNDPISTADNTLRRKTFVCRGDTDAGNAFDPALEWEGFAPDDFSGLGAHVAACDFIFRDGFE